MVPSILPYPLAGDRPDRPTRWKVYYLGPGGKRVCRSFRGTKREAQHWAEEQEAAARARPAAQAPSSQTLREYLAEWLPGHAARQALKPRSIEAHVFLTDQYILPTLGDVRLRDLTTATLDTWMQRLLTEPRASGHVLSARTVTMARTTLHLALKHAVATERIPVNPLERVPRPRLRPRPAQPLTADETRAVLAHVAEYRLGPLFVLCLHLGLRISEALALQWEDVDLEAGLISVRRNVSTPHSTRAYLATAVARWAGQAEPSPPTRSKRRVYGTPKTRAGARSWPLPPQTAQALRAWGRLQRDEREIAGAQWRDTGLVFTTRTGGPLAYGNVWESWNIVLTRAGVAKRGLHAERHTAVSRALDAGLSLVEVSEMIGDADPSVTMRVYAHLLDPEQTAAAQKLAQRLALDPAPYAETPENGRQDATTRAQPPEAQDP